MQQFLNFKATSEATKSTDELVNFPNAESVLADTKYFDCKILLPKYSFAGEIINAAYSGLQFHFVVAPIFIDCVDFRLNAENKYELLRFDKQAATDFSDDYMNRAAREMEEAFDEFEDKPSFYTLYDDTGEYVSGKVKLKIDEPCWCQSHYQRLKTAKELAASTDDDKYTTDYKLPIFKDENNDKLHFIAELYAGDVFGSYYLFFSPKTRLVRQFFQCT